ncbi:MAG: response regulator, partial [Bdellovibrionales bacterium]|nr:response regulator [Bdellovibrionales bacterium]
MSEKLKAIVVDDDESFAKLVSIRLKSWNESIDIDTASDVASARKLLENASTNYRLAILDNHLPDGSGFELMDHSGLENAAVLSVSSDDAPELPAQNVRAGAHHFLEKRNISAPLFIPLVEAILERKKLEEQIKDSAVKAARLDTIKTLVATLRHEINNP